MSFKKRDVLVCLVVEETIWEKCILIPQVKINVVIQNEQTTSKIDDDFHWKELAYLYKITSTQTCMKHDKTI
jgi:ribosomal protein L31E